MYINLPNLTDENLTKLINLSNAVTYYSRIEHLGVHGRDKLSNYVNSKWYEWQREQRHEFKNSFDSRLSSKAVIGWFLKFPKDLGFLDQMEYWKNTNAAGVVLTYALNDNQDILIDGQLVKVPKGQGIAFSLRTTHEVTAKSTEQVWACLMTMAMPQE